MSGSIAVPAARRVLEGKQYDNQENAPLPGCGPKGYPGMPEVGNMPIPRCLVEKGVLELKVSEAELAERRQHWTPDPPHYSRGYARLYIDHVMQADRGADLDFLVGEDTRPVTRESH
jgi:dihydroxy-acid dehydratase